MRPQDLKELIRQPEGLKLEFKREFYKVDLPDRQAANLYWNELVKDVLALANGNVNIAGETAYIIIGVGDEVQADGSRRIYSVDQMPVSRTQVLDKVNATCSPPLPDIQIETIRLDEGQVHVIVIPPSPHLHETTKPLKTPSRSYGENTLFIRRGEGVSLASHTEAQAILIEKQRVMHRSTKEDLARSVFAASAVGGQSDELARIEAERKPGWELRLLGAAWTAQIEANRSLRWDVDYGVPKGPYQSLDSERSVEWLQQRLHQLEHLLSSFESVVYTALPDALGLPGHPGDAERIRYVAQRIGDLYRSSLQWTLDFSAIRVDETYRQLAEIESRFAAHVAPRLEAALVQLNEGTERALTDIIKGRTPPPVSVDIVISIPDDLLRQYHAEVERLTIRNATSIGVVPAVPEAASPVVHAQKHTATGLAGGCGTLILYALVWTFVVGIIGALLQVLRVPAMFDSANNLTDPGVLIVLLVSTPVTWVLMRPRTRTSRLIAATRRLYHSSIPPHSQLSSLANDAAPIEANETRLTLQDDLVAASLRQRLLSRSSLILLVSTMVAWTGAGLLASRDDIAGMIGGGIAGLLFGIIAGPAVVLVVQVISWMCDQVGTWRHFVLAMLVGLTMILSIASFRIPSPSTSLSLNAMSSIMVGFMLSSVLVLIPVGLTFLAHRLR